MLSRPRGGKPRVQNGDSISYRDAVFELLARKRQRSGQIYDPLEIVVDRDHSPGCQSLFVAPAVQFVLATGLLAKIITTCASGGPNLPRVHPGGSVCIPGAQIVQHRMHVMLLAKRLMCAHEATRGIVRLRIPSNIENMLL